MAKINDNFRLLEPSYLFSGIASRQAAFASAHPEIKVIRMGVGDVTLPLAPAVIKAMHEAVDECSSAATFRGYGPEQGYGFLRELIASCDYAGLGISPDEVFVSDGAKSDLGNLTDLFSDDCVIGIPTPVYPVYVDTNLLRGRTIRYIECTEDDGFTGVIPDFGVDVLYLCFPNNPTGAAISRDKLRAWVDYALSHDSIIIYDSAYEAFIRDASLPHSIFEIEGAKHCAIEVRSYSKTAGFTGIRCGYTVIPKETGRLGAMWERRQGCKFNGASYVSQCGAAAIYTPEGRAQTKASIDYYLDNAVLIRKGFEEMGIPSTGGDNAPYIWTRTPGGMSSWKFFDLCLGKAGVVITPGCGFGKAGEGYFRVTAFNSRENVTEAIKRLKTCLQTVL